MITSPPNPTARPFIRERATGPFWYAQWWRKGKPVTRALGRAWAERDGNGGWRRRRGRSRDGALTEAAAAERMLQLVRAHDAQQTAIELAAAGKRLTGGTFQELAREYLTWLETVEGAKPSTLRDHRSLLAEPGAPQPRGSGVYAGLIMARLGDVPAREITVDMVDDLLASIAAGGVSARTVNKTRQLVCAAFNYGMRPKTWALPRNPAAESDRRREGDRATIAFYSAEQVEILAEALGAGAHRYPDRPAVKPEEVEAQSAEDRQDADIIRVAAYAGLRRGELIALHWRDVDLAKRKITVRRSVSGGEELQSTKGRRFREVPIPDQAMAALRRLQRRGEFVSPDDYVFANRYGRRIDGSALRRRFQRARDAAALEPLRFHDLRHTYGSLLVAGGVDLVSVKAAMGHSRITTTERYLHARPADEQADLFTRAIAGRQWQLQKATPGRGGSAEPTKRKRKRR
jgi:integrase